MQVTKFDIKGEDKWIGRFKTLIYKLACAWRLIKSHRFVLTRVQEDERAYNLKVDRLNVSMDVYSDILYATSLEIQDYCNHCRNVENITKASNANT